MVLTLVAEAAVCVVRPAGNWTGRVGDLGLGLINPMPRDSKEASMGGGMFLATEEAVDLVVLADEAALGVVVAEEAALGVVVAVLVGSLGVCGFTGLVGVFGDLVGGLVLVFATEIILGTGLLSDAFGASLLGAFTAGSGRPLVPLRLTLRPTSRATSARCPEPPVALPVGPPVFPVLLGPLLSVSFVSPFALRPLGVS